MARVYEERRQVYEGVIEYETSPFSHRGQYLIDDDEISEIIRDFEGSKVRLIIEELKDE